MKKRQNISIYLLILIGVISVLVSSCEKEDEDNTFTDTRDSTVYKTVTIGTQVWMAENLKYLPSIVGPAKGSQTTPYYYIHGYDGANVTEAKATANYNIYGVLYNWPAAKAACPTGWHLPTDDEWKQLEMALGMTQQQANALGSRGSNQGTQMKATFGWYKNGNGTNTSGFSALPGGYRHFDGDFHDVGLSGLWWSSTEYSASDAWSRSLNYYSLSDVGRTEYYSFKELGFSVRCVRD